MDSIDVLERVANTERPPLNAKEIEEIGNKLGSRAQTQEDIQGRPSNMATAFEGRADANTWSDELLGKIDDCFVEYFYEGGAPCSFLFFPACPQYLNRFSGYRNDVDRILRENPDLAPPYAREYFAYAMIWQLHGYKFPMPLGTASVIEAVHVLATRFCRGVCEVSTSLPVANSLPCPPRIGYLSMRGILLGEGLSTAHGLFVYARYSILQYINLFILSDCLVVGYLRLSGT